MADTATRLVVNESNVNDHRKNSSSYNGHICSHSLSALSGLPTMFVPVFANYYSLNKLLILDISMTDICCWLHPRNHASL